LIVLVHAGICDASMWDGFDLPGAVRHELRGFGGTPLPESGVYSDADDLETRLGAEPSTLVGASFGGQVCLEVAARRPDLVTELVLLAERLAAEIADAELVVMESVTHLPPLERPDETARLVREFLAR
jgi:3-oxoadipate enol-lactonase